MWPQKRMLYPVFIIKKGFYKPSGTERKMTYDSEPALRLVGMVVKGRENGVLIILERVAL